MNNFQYIINNLLFPFILIASLGIGTCQNCVDKASQQELAKKRAEKKAKKILAGAGKVPREFSSDFNRIRQYNAVIQTAIQKYCRHQPPKYLVQGVFWQESRGIWWLINDVSATGVGQWIPGSAHSYGLTPTYLGMSRNYNLADYARQMIELRSQCFKSTRTYDRFYHCLVSRDARFNPWRSAVATVRHLCGDYERLKGDHPGPQDHHWRLALQAYYQGKSTVAKKRSVFRWATRQLILKWNMEKFARLTEKQRRRRYVFLKWKKIDYFARVLMRRRRFQQLMDRDPPPAKPIKGRRFYRRFGQKQNNFLRSYCRKWRNRFKKVCRDYRKRRKRRRGSRRQRPRGYRCGGKWLRRCKKLRWRWHNCCRKR